MGRPLDAERRPSIVAAGRLLADDVFAEQGTADHQGRLGSAQGAPAAVEVADEPQGGLHDVRDGFRRTQWPPGRAAVAANQPAGRVHGRRRRLGRVQRTAGRRGVAVLPHDVRGRPRGSQNAAVVAGTRGRKHTECGKLRVRWRSQRGGRATGVEGVPSAYGR